LISGLKEAIIFFPVKTCPLYTRDLYSCIITSGVLRKRVFFSQEAQAAWALLPGTLAPKSVWILTYLRAESALKAGIMMEDVSNVLVSEGLSFGRGPLQLTDIIIILVSTHEIRIFLFFLTVNRLPG
jgi:hypothetical protein